MKRVLQISLLAVVGIGALVDALMDDSPERPSSPARQTEEPRAPGRSTTSTSERARLSLLTEQGGGWGGSVVENYEEHPDLGWYEEPGDDEDEGHDDGVDVDDETSIVRNRELFERRAAAINAAVEREEVDLGWAPAMERQITEGLVAHGPPGTKLISTICKTTLCMAELEFPPVGGGTGYVNWLTAFGLSRGLFVHHEAESGMGARTDAYLARDGYSLPEAAEHDP